ncbi:ATP-binding cassette domain-containing protein [Agrobacterium vitis]|uniref:ATP-binding cassette domain-containing protein n=1 Tax=Agrobacterium vitis TaxID=373 RepID=UPI000872E3EC|nr:ATP-binding cassette domain-containing protein [Agrobacterium vitis]MCE6075776.1 ATP-binding cassette domain-containing protein [Agrobacterium vitis]MCM2449299.1 ATP-binding cassette domain-containing protein [Agrobacterium vitis]MCM2468256.1 ATP-binding cassette domain-containing protein [Agrobacterium vitis]MUO70282.1 ATP-binding cassette domain-containing protein [Agrobacterium vitis]MUO82527.1 ATP-binding cassette domain-containing protein [Agrobacterium vitis]
MTATTMTRLRPVQEAHPATRQEQASPPVLASARPAFSFRNVRKSFGTQTVLDGINLDVAEGEFLAIIGKSGCGKSTLLRLLAGLDKPSSGELVHHADKSDAARVRMMFQEPRLLPWAKIDDNVAVGLTGIAKGKEALSAARALLEEVGLGARASEWPSVLSGGQKQRVALARALAAHPHILALDEPLGALDALTRIEMQQLLERIWQKQRFTAVLVTHDVSEAVALADRIVVIDAGRIALDLKVALPRPRRHATAECAAIEAQILEKLLGDAAPA